MRYVTTALVVLAALALLTPRATPEEEEKSPAEMMGIMMKYATPGKHHKGLEYFLGEWDMAIKMKMPGMGELASKGSSKFEWIFPGRWLSQRMEATMMGMPYQGFGISGFDNYKKKFVSTFVSTMDTAMLRTEGVPVDPEGKVFVEYGRLDEPTMAQHDKEFKVVTRKVDADRFTVEIWDLGIGPDGFAVLEYTYTRKQK